MRTGSSSPCVPVGSLAKAAGPLRRRKAGLQIGWRQDRDGAFARGCRVLHVQGKVGAGAKVPGLDHGGVARGFQLPGDPLGPGAIDMGVADKEVGHGFALSHRRRRQSGSALTMDPITWASALAPVCIGTRVLMATWVYTTISRQTWWTRGRLWVPRPHRPAYEMRIQGMPAFQKSSALSCGRHRPKLQQGPRRSCRFFPLFQSFREKQRRYCHCQRCRFHRCVSIRLRDDEIVEKHRVQPNPPPNGCSKASRTYLVSRRGHGLCRHLSSCLSRNCNRIFCILLQYA